MRDAEAIEALVAPALERVGAELVEIVLRGRRGNQVLEVYIDSDTGVTADLCSQVSREVGALLDRNDIIQGRYVLVVSSPGLDRPLATLRQYRKNIGKQLKVTVQDAGQKRQVQGRLVHCDETGIALSLEDQTTVNFPFDAIVDARVSLPW